MHQKFIYIVFLFLINISLSAKTNFEPCKVEGLIGEYPEEICQVFQNRLLRAKFFEFNRKIREARNNEEADKLISEKETYCGEHRSIIRSQSYISRKTERNMILLAGPAGNGKTTIVKKLAEYLNAEFLVLRGSEVVDQYQGGGADRIREFFEKINLLIQEGNMVVACLDEVDVIASVEQPQNTKDYYAATTQLLGELDKLRGNPQFVFVAATNYLDKLTKAFKDRMSYIIEIPNPSKEVRQEVLAYYFEQEGFDLGSVRKNSSSSAYSNLESRRKGLLDDLAKKTEGVSVRSLEAYAGKVAACSEMGEVFESNLYSLVPKPIKEKDDKKEDSKPGLLMRAGESAGSFVYHAATLSVPVLVGYCLNSHGSSKKTSNDTSKK